MHCANVSAVQICMDKDCNIPKMKKGLQDNTPYKSRTKEQTICWR